MTTETLHRLDITISRGRTEHRFTCAGTSLASCHLVCPQGCDSWQLDHVAEMTARFAGAPDAAEEAQRHELVDGGECNLIAFIANDGDDLDELYDGDPHELVSGPVTLDYQDEYVTWSYADVSFVAVPLDGVEG